MRRGFLGWQGRGGLSRAFFFFSWFRMVGEEEGIGKKGGGFLWKTKQRKRGRTWMLGRYSEVENKTGRDDRTMHGRR